MTPPMLGAWGQTRAVTESKRKTQRRDKVGTRIKPTHEGAPEAVFFFFQFRKTVEVCANYDKIKCTVWIYDSPMQIIAVIKSLQFVMVK